MADHNAFPPDEYLSEAEVSELHDILTQQLVACAFLPVR